MRLLAIAELADVVRTAAVRNILTLFICEKKKIPK
jgi:hypothetical protein